MSDVAAASRLHLHAHTLAQVIAGGALGAVIAASVFIQLRCGNQNTAGVAIRVTDAACWLPRSCGIQIQSDGSRRRPTYAATRRCCNAVNLSCSPRASAFLVALIRLSSLPS